MHLGNGGKMGDGMLVLIDLDKTLIDASYRVTDGGIRNAIESAQAGGHLIGLSSDSALATLATWHEEFGMNGPILAERGAVYQATRFSGAVPTGSADESCFAAMREFYRARLFGLGFEVAICDPSVWIRSGQSRYVVKKTALLNAHRRWSFHASFLGDDAAVNLALDLFVAACSEFALRSEDFYLDANTEYGLLIVHSRLSHKGFGMAKLMQDLGFSEASVIGDGENDFTGLASVRHWAVGNANSVYKSRCDRVAGQPYTSGVIELLSGL